MNQHSCDGTDDNLTSLPEDEIMSMYGRKTQLVDSAKAFLEKVVTWSNYIMQAVCDARQRMSSNLTARMTNGLTRCKEIIWRDKLESRDMTDAILDGQSSGCITMPIARSAGIADLRY